VDQSGALEDRDVPRHTREGHRQRARQVADPGITGQQRDEQRAPRAVGEGRVCGVQDGIFNWLVDFLAPTA
jgi:hypothetical protein